MSYTATNLGFLSGGSSSVATAVSADGTVVTGNAAGADTRNRAVWWDSSNVIHELPGQIGSDAGFNNAGGCSSDGTIIVGSLVTSVPSQVACIWSGGPSYGTPTQLAAPGGTTEALANACSGDATLLVGLSNQAGILVPTIWTSGTPSLLPLPAGGYIYGQASDCSRDGTVITGFVSTDHAGNGPTVPVVWTGGPSWSVSILATQAGGDSQENNAAFACSSNGGIVVGEAADSGNNSFAVFWNPTTLNQFAGPVGGSGSAAFGCDPTATYVVGTAADGGAALWTSGVGQELPLFSGATSVTSGIAVSDGGSVIVGTGIDGSSNQVAVKWSFSVPPPPPPTPAVVLPPLCGWRGLTGINWNGLALVGDKFTNVVGLSDFTIFTEYGNGMQMLATAPPLHDDRKRIFVSRFEVEVEAGLGTPGAPETAPLLILDYSKNGGITWVPLQVFRSMGAAGEYIKRLRWINIGQSRTWVFRIQYTGAARPSIIGTYMDFYRGLG